MAIRACIRLKKEASELTRAHFVAAIDEIKTFCKTGIPRTTLSVNKSSLKSSKESERIYPFSAEDKMVGNNDVVWFSISESKYIPLFKIMGKLHMERGRVGDKYQIIIEPGPTEIE